MLQLGFFPTAGEPGAFPADAHPLRDRAALPRPPSHGLKLEVGSFCTWPQRANSGPAKRVHGHLQGKELGVPTALCYEGQRWLGKGQSRGHGTCCHCLHPALLGSSIVTDSTYCTPQSCLGSSDHHCSPTRAAGPGAALAPRVTAWSRLLQQGISPGQSGATGGTAPHVSGIGPGRVSIHGVTGLSSFVPLQGGQGTLQSPCMGCVVWGCWLLPDPGSSPEQILC